MRDTSKYVLNGVRLPSVTEVLALAGMDRWENVPLSVLQKAKIRGSDVHEWLEGIDLGLLAGLEPDERVAPYATGYIEWKERSGFEIDLVEKVVVNELFLYAGTLDRTGTLNGKRYLIDIKTGEPTKAAALQTAGYAECLEGEWNRATLWLKPDGPAVLDPHKDRNDRDDFLSAVRVAHWVLRNGLATLED